MGVFLSYGLKNEKPQKDQKGRNIFLLHDKEMVAESSYVKGD